MTGMAVHYPQPSIDWATNAQQMSIVVLSAIAILINRYFQGLKLLAKTIKYCILRIIAKESDMKRAQKESGKKNFSKLSFRAYLNNPRMF